MKKILSVILFICITFSLLPVAVYANQYTNDPVIIKMYDVYSRAISSWGRENFYGYCGACVNYQLLTYGINSKYVGLNGNQAYAHYSKQATTSGGYSTKSFPAGEYSLSELIYFLNTDSSSNGDFPVVLGYNKGTASQAGQTYGHTMLIYEVCGGYVYYTDSILSKWQDNVHKQSINDFLWAYSDKIETAEKEFVFDGGVQFYKKAPSTANVRLNKSKFSLWEIVDFYISAPGSTSTAIGIDRNGERITTVLLGSKRHTSLQFGESGVYTVYVTSSNLYGSVDSYTVNFEVYDVAPTNAYIKAAHDAVALYSPIYAEFGATNASIYCIGVSEPNGQYTVYFSETGSYNIPTKQKGIHTIFVSCCNAYGYVDTQKITINVY